MSGESCDGDKLANRRFWRSLVFEAERIDAGEVIRVPFGGTLQLLHDLRRDILQRRFHELLLLTKEHATLVPSLPQHLGAKGPVPERPMTRKTIVRRSPLWPVSKLEQVL